MFNRSDNVAHIKHNGLQTCEGKDLEIIIFNLKQISNETQIFN